MVSITGTFEQISESLEQLAWLAATLRPHFEGELTVSEIDFRAWQPELQTQSRSIHNFPSFNLSLISPDKVLSIQSQDPGQCWTALFTESVLAYGFPTPENSRPEGALGLEIPFELMAAFAGVTFPIILGGRIAFANSSSVLIPEISFEDSIQWHFGKIDDIVKQGGRNHKVVDPRLETLNLAKFTTSRAFLGYCKTSEVLLGTKDFKDVEVAESEVPETGPRFQLKLEGPLSASISAKGYATVTAGTTWKLNRGETASIETHQLEQDERLKRAKRNSVLLYDQDSCTAFLVSELSVVLQMVSVYLINDTRLATPKIPFAAALSDGGEAAHKTIVKAQDLMIPCMIGPPRKFIDIIDSFLLVLAQRKQQVSIRRKEFGEVSLKAGLRGWDYADVQEKAYEFCERELQTRLLGPRPIWWKLFKHSTTLVLFARMRGSPIRPGKVHAGIYDCRAWEEIPRGRHLLLTTMTQLERVKQERCRNASKYPLRYMLTNKLAWARPKHSRLFEERCRDGGSCNPLQTMIKVGYVRERARGMREIFRGNGAYLQVPGDIQLSGAVLFADDPSAFDRRPCRRPQPQVQVPVRSNWKVSVVFACMALALAVLWGCRLVT